MYRYVVRYLKVLMATVFSEFTSFRLRWGQEFLLVDSGALLDVNANKKINKNTSFVLNSSFFLAGIC